jgi:WXG100 family type VII secretion target
VGQVGAELEGLIALRSNFSTQAEKVSELVSSIGSQVHNVWWKGPAADRFRNAWDSEFQPTLNKLHEALNDAGSEVQRRHDAIQAATS